MKKPNFGINNRLRFILKLLISLGLIGAILYFIDFKRLVELAVNLNPMYLIGAVGVIYLDRMLMAYKWGILSRALQVRVPFFISFRLYFVAPLLGMFLPLNIGEDMFRVYSLSRYKVSTKAVLTSIIMERGLGLIAVVMMCIVSLVLAFYLLQGSMSHFSGIGWALGVGAVASLSLIGATYGIFNGVFDNWAEKLARIPVVSRFHEIYLLSQQYRHHSGMLARVFGWTFLEQLSPIIIIYLMVLALHVDVSLTQLVMIAPLFLLSTRLPIASDNFGVGEGVIIGLLALIDVSATEALMVGLLIRAADLICAVPWVIHYVATGHQKVLTEPKIPSVGAE
jgi:uncharacterized protein (TIRG00374 family)